MEKTSEITGEKDYYYTSEDTKLYKIGEKFYKNGEELEDENGKFSDEKFDKEIKKNVSGLINNKFENIVCLIGAGASVVKGDDGKPDDKYGKTMSMLSERIYSSLKGSKYTFDEDENEVKVFSLNELIKKVQYEPNGSSTESNDDDSEIPSDFNLEDFLSYILAYEKFIKMEEKEEFNNSKKAIFQEIIKATSYEYDSGKFSHAKFLNTLSKYTKKEQKLNIITTNYDTLIEDSANFEGFTVLDGFKFAQLPIFDASMFDWHFIKDVPNIKTQEVEYMSKVINLLKIHGSLTWEYNKNNELIYRKPKNNIENPVMIFPSSDKYALSYQEPYFELFTKFQELLKRNNTLLIVTGFSFADNHISRMILQALKTNVSLQILVTDLDIQLEGHNENWEKLVKMQENNYQVSLLKATMNGKLTNYLGEEK